MNLKKVKVLILLLIVSILSIYLDNTIQDTNRPTGDDKVELSEEFYGYLLDLLHNSPFPGVDNYAIYSMDRLGLEPLKDCRPLLSDFGPVLNDVTSFRYLKDIKRKCREGTTILFIAIISAPANIGKRNAIRATWLRRLNEETTTHAFILGRTTETAVQDQIDQESKVHGDVIQVDMMDGYYNLTLKVTSLLNWLDKSCHPVDFVLKVDDDVYVNVNNLTGLVKDLSPFRHIPSIYGFRSSSPPLRGGTKWSISYEDWPWSAYPPFFMGAGILMTGTAIRPLLAAAQTVPFMPFDDVYLTGLCSLKAGIELWTSERIFDDVAAYRPNGCFVQFTTTWTTRSVAHMELSEKEVDLFYRNVTHCPVHLVMHDHFVPIESYVIH